MRKWLSLLLAALLVLSLCACGQTAQEPEPVQTPAEEPSAEPISAAIPQPAATHQIQLVRATANGYTVMELEQEDEFLARAVLPDDESVVDHWELNGEFADPGDRQYSLVFNSSDVYVVEAYIRPAKNVSCVKNCYLQFLNDDGEPAGDKYKRVFFEDFYTEPVTDTPHEGGSITACVTAFVPAGKSVDYWIINGAAFRTEQEIRAFIFVGLRDSLEIEAVLKDGMGGTPVTSLMGTFDPGRGRGQPVSHPDDDVPEGRTVPAVQKWDPFDDGVDGDLFDDTPDPGSSAIQAPPSEGDHEHDWQLNPGRSWAPTCTGEGQDLYVCSICGKEFANRIPATGHQFYWSSNGWWSGHTQHCSVCGATGLTEAHTEITDYTGSWDCPVCGEHYTAIN